MARLLTQVRKTVLYFRKKRSCWSFLLGLVAASTLSACTHQNIQKAEVKTAQKIQQAKQVKIKEVEAIHSKAWTQLQAARGYLKAKDFDKAQAAFAKSHRFYENLYGKYSLRIAQFDSVAGAYADQAKAWDLADYYYNQSLRVHRAMAVVLPEKLKQDRIHLKSLYQHARHMYNAPTQK